MRSHMDTEDLILLVGSNPLPNYLVALMLRPKKAWLLYTQGSQGTESVKKRLARALQEQGIPTDERSIRDATSAKAAREAVRSVPNKGAALHYTGGTKTMSTHVYQEWKACGGGDEQASYFDGEAETLRFDNGYDWPLKDAGLQLDLKTLTRLHGLQRYKERTPIDGGPTPQDAEAIARKVLLVERSLAARLYDAVNESPGKLKSARTMHGIPVNLRDDFGLTTLGAPVVPGYGWSTKRVKSWQDLLKGDWLEEWTGQCVARCDFGVLHYVGVNAFRENGSDFEVDVAVIRGHRLYLISCTTDTEKGMCKSKLFEVMLRARHLGGDLARSALVCLLQEKEQVTTEALEKEVQEDWETRNQPKVFGPKHLCEWLRDDTHASKLSSLKEWLNS